MHTKVVVFATVVGLVGMMASADAAPNRGTPGSQERKNWCDSKLRDCYDAAKETCEFTYPPSISPDCISGRKKSCDSSYGSNSTCTTAPRISQPGGAVTPPVRPGVVEPGPRTLSTAPFSKQGMTAPMIQPRGVEGEGAPATAAPTEQKNTTPAPK